MTATKCTIMTLNSLSSNWTTVIQLAFIFVRR